MAENKTAYVYNIDPVGSGVSENNSIHQTSPAWVLTFIRWSVRDTLRTKPTQEMNYTTTVTTPLVVQNDCIQVSVADSKGTLTPSMSATLLITDINYETAINTGDFVFVNMLNWESKAQEVAENARNLLPINGIKDGFKGFFKVQSVRKSLNVNPETGTKSYMVKITGFAFTEFNNSIYFNPNLLTTQDTTNLQLYLTNIKKDWDNIQTNKGITRIQSIVEFLINSFVGQGFPDNERKTNQYSPLTANTHFFMPKGVGNLLGLSELLAAKDAYNYLFGIQQYNPNATSAEAGMNPSGIPSDVTATKGRVIETGIPVEGFTVVKPEYWNQTKAWDILNQFSNAPLNELFTSFRIAPNGSVMPTMVFRQIPFTTDNFVSGSSFKVTRFMSLPRWKINPTLALSFDLGKDETLRLNFMQFYGKSVNSPIKDHDISTETAMQNYVYDIDDVKRNGLRPAVITSEFDTLPLGEVKGYRSPGWAKIMGDALIGGHLKMSGTINYVGIEAPIAVGDNLQFDNTVYHIEQISHNAMVQPDGKKVFRTTIIVSSGMDIQNSASGVVYSEMQYQNAYDSRAADFDVENGGSQILPGVSESQNVPSRSTNPDFPITTTNTPFIEPNTNTAINKSTRDS